MSRPDPHSYADDAHPQTASFALVAHADFATCVIAAEVTLAFQAPGAGPLDLDTRDLAIESIVLAEGVVRKAPELIKSATVGDVELHLTQVGGAAVVSVILAFDGVLG